ncbi:MAG: RING finger domain-containing protein [Candidatus Thorarchaeota archaeon]
MKTILNEKKKDLSLVILLIVGITFTALAWVGDIISWSWIGNGFILDVILLVICIILTIGLVTFYRNYKKRKSYPSLSQEQISSLTDEEIKTKLADDSLDSTSIELIKAEFNKRKIKSKKFPIGSIAITCPSCGFTLKFEEDKCSSCGSALPACVVCLSDFNITDEIVKTPCCQQYAHRDHILNWINVNGLCPSCKIELNKDELIKVHFID